MDLRILKSKVLAEISSRYFERSHIAIKTNDEFQNFDIIWKVDFLVLCSLCVRKFQKTNKNTPLANLSLSSWKKIFQRISAKIWSHYEENEQHLWLSAFIEGVALADRTAQTVKPWVFEVKFIDCCTSKSYPDDNFI